MTMDIKVHNSDPNDYQKQFMPIWKQYMLFWKIVGLVWIPLILIAIFIQTVRESLFKIGPFLFFPTLICALYFQLIKLRCPKCDSLLQFWQVGRGCFVLTGECPSCSVQLKTRLMPNKAIKMLVVLIVAIFLIMVIVAFLKGSIKIEHQI